MVESTFACQLDLSKCFLWSWKAQQNLNFYYAQQIKDFGVCARANQMQRREKADRHFPFKPRPSQKPPPTHVHAHTSI